MSQAAPTHPLRLDTRLGPLTVTTRGSGPPAVLWHSLFVDSTTWCRVAPLLEPARQLLLIDGPNHAGQPPASRPFTLQDCVGAAVDVLDELGISGPVDWLGNAWGGHVGMHVAAGFLDDQGYFDTARAQPVTRLGGAEYAISQPTFVLPRQFTRANEGNY